MGAEIITSKLYHGDAFIGEVCICPQYEDANLMGNISEGIHISHFSCPSKRCPPLVVLHSVAMNGVCFKMEPKEQQSQHDQINLKSLYDACLLEEKTAIVPVGNNELHLVAMLSGDRDNDVPRFWGFYVDSGLYGSCLGMLNLRCLAIVFDLDETLVVANTMRSFEDRIEALRRKKLGEVDPQRASGISAEIKRYQEDKRLLKQFTDSDQVFDNGKLIRAQSEIVPPLSDIHLPLVRPIIRLQERNIILTRINPNVRDTSVLVRMRPAWEEFRHYLVANGRKRFEVFICTMSEKDYALEMWRLLDPESSLISPQELRDRVICVKSGLKKSLLNVFHNGTCHPKIALVIDDRLKVWEDRDQSRVYVVPAFAPYYAPLAETSVPLPILGVARNVACNVRGSFYKDFDEGLLQQMAGVFYENDVTNLPVPPDVCTYLVKQIQDGVANSNKTNLPVPYTMENSEAERKSDLQDQNLLTNTTPACAVMKNQDPRLFIQPLQKPLLVTSSCNAQVQVSEKVLEHSIGMSAGSEPISNGSPVREEGEIPESDMDPNTRRRLLILQHGQDPGQRDFNSYNPPVLMSMAQSNVPPNHHLAGLVRGIGPQLSKQSQGLSLGFDSQAFDGQRLNNSFYHGLESSLPSNRNACIFIRQPPRKRFCGDGSLTNEPRLHDYSSPGKHLPKLGSVGAGGCTGHNGWVEKQSRDLQTCMGFTGVSMNDDMSVASTSGQSKNANLGYANHYMENANQEKGEVQPSRGIASSMGYMGGPCVDEIKIASMSTQATISEQSGDDNSEGSYDPVVALEELCIKEGLDLVFQNQKSNGVDNAMESYAQVEVAGQILGRKCCSTWEEAKLQAAEEALKNLEASSNRCALKRLNSSRMTPDQPNKKIKPEELVQVAP